MDYLEWDIPETSPVNGGISRAWRKVCHSRKDRAATQARARRSLRRAVRQAIAKGGDPRDLPTPLTAWVIY